MKSYLRLSLTALAVILFFNAFAVTETKAQGILNEILKRMEAHRQALTSLQSNVTRDIYNSQLDEHDMSEGTTMYLPAKGRDALIRIDWMKPVQETLSVVNKEYVLYQPRLKQAYIGKADGKSKNTKGANALSFMSMSKDQLKTNYAVEYVGKETVGGNAETWHLKLTPKIASDYQYAEIWVDGNGMPLQGKVVEKNNDSTTILLTTLQKNANVDAKKFKVILPKDTKILKV